MTQRILWEVMVIITLALLSPSAFAAKTPDATKKGEILTAYLVSLLITGSCCGYADRRSSLLASSKSLKSNPGATVHPARVYEPGSFTVAPNHSPALITA